MQKNSVVTYLDRFFDMLEMQDDLRLHTDHKCMLKQAILTFLADETKDNAFDVFQCFFDSYRIVLAGDTNPFVDLLDVLSAYEERAATLIDRQRDHYIHSVNVFILGLCIYAQNTAYRRAFADANMDPVRYPSNYATAHEEFFFRWGVASLFHDVGYPVEIITKQILKFISFATAADHDDTKGKIKAHLEFENFRRLNSIAEVLPKRDFIADFYQRNEGSVYIDLLQPIDLIAHRIHLTLDIPLEQIKNKLDTFMQDMARYGFVDHGFYSAIIVLKWYGYLIQQSRMDSLFFYHSVVDSASAIMLHNYYRNVIQKSFGKGPLAAEQNPIAFLLILCDELQEWNRAAFGIEDKKRAQAAQANLRVDERSFRITYLTERGVMPRDFAREKKKLFTSLLWVDQLFPDRFTIRCETLDEVFVQARGDVLVPRPMWANLEALARVIHEDYVRTAKARGQAIFVAERYEDLEDSIRYANLHQARNIGKKLAQLGFGIVSADDECPAVEAFTGEELERYAQLEHADWMAGKEHAGWTYAPVRDDKKKWHPAMVPWCDLSKEDKQKDRDAGQNLFKLVKMVGLKVVRVE